MSRGFAAVLMCPISTPLSCGPGAHVVGDVVTHVAFGFPKLGWLKKLKASARNCSEKRSVNLMLFSRAKSRFTYPGPVRMLRPELPNRGVPAARAAWNELVVKQAGLNHSETVCGPTPEQMRSGRGTWELLLEKSVAEKTVNGRPSAPRKCRTTPNPLLPGQVLRSRSATVDLDQTVNSNLGWLRSAGGHRSPLSNAGTSKVDHFG